MKKLSVLVIAVLMATLCMFVACNKPDDYNDANEYTAVFEVVPDGYGNLDTRVDDTISAIKSLLSSNGITRLSITKGTNSVGNITVSVQVLDTEDNKRVLCLIGRPVTLEFKGENSASAENLIVGREHLETAFITRDSNDNYAIGLKFNEQGAEKFAQVTSAYLNRTIYVYFDGELYTSVIVNSQIATGEAIITTGSYGYTYTEAKEFVTRLQAGAFGVNLRQTEV
ncbi:MAG: hypothetical protein K2N18_01270 [Clostridia bacterium]|nr:hypothetical protein [Clostridia bacterium]